MIIINWYNKIMVLGGLKKRNGKRIDLAKRERAMGRYSNSATIGVRI
jgi:hypothetical protein